MNIRKINKTIFGLSVIVIMIIVSYRPINASVSDITTNDDPMDGIQLLTIIANNYDLNEYTGVVDPLVLFGCNNTIAGPAAHITTGGYLQPTDLLISEVDVTDYDCIFIPGGLSPDNLIGIPEFITLIQDADAHEICMAGICSGPLVFAAADIVNGKNVTGNIAIKAELVAAGGIYFDGARCVTHDYLITADNPYMFELVIAVTQVLGFYENDPPDIGEPNYELICDGSSFECSLEVEVTDEFGVESVQALAYQLSNDGSTKTLVKSPYLLDPEEDSNYSSIMTGLSPGDYIIELKAQDVLGNEFTNTSFLELTIEDPNQSGINLATISVFTILTTVLITTKRRRK